MAEHTLVPPPLRTPHVSMEGVWQRRNEGDGPLTLVLRVVTRPCMIGGLPGPLQVWNVCIAR